jgi:two-component system, LytTR family, sensor kinase
MASPLQSSRHPPRPRIWLLLSAGWIGPAILGALVAYAQGRLGTSPAVTWRNLLWEGGDWLLYGLLTPIVMYLAGRWPLRHGSLFRQIPLHLTAALVLCVAWAGAGTLLRNALLPESDAFTREFFVSWTLTTLPFGVLVYFALVGIEHAVHYFLEARERETQAAQLSARLAEARLGALRMQIHPHFLLNSLNAITVLVRDQDTRTATRLLEQLGEVLRRVLRSDRRHEVPLKEEIEFLRRYLDIEQVRFPERLRPALDIEPSVTGAAVPDFILQPLVENAIRHGVAQRSDAGKLTISARRRGDRLVLTVEDDGPGPAAKERDGVGLGNAQERLAALYGDRARLELTVHPAGGTIATIELPYRELAGD